MNDYQISFGGLTIGEGTDYGIAEVLGLEDFTARFSDDFTASRWGSIVGTDQVGSRTVTLAIRCQTETAAQAVMSAFAPAAQTTPATLGELAWKFPDSPEKTVSARCRRRTRPRTLGSEAARLWLITVELNAPDPRAYSTDSHQAALAPFSEASYYLDMTESSATNLGIEVDVSSGTNLAVNLLGTAAAGSQFLLNDGDTETWPTVTFSTSTELTSWRLRNLTTEGVADFYWPLGANQHLVVDFAVVATPKQGDAVLLDGSPRYSAWLHPRTPLEMAPGLNELRFDILDGDDDTSTASVVWKDAWQ